ncbi:MAG: phytase [Flavobacteriaceae bacterium]
MKECLFVISLINACFSFAQESKLLGSLPYREVSADIETAPVFAGDDAADDICILENKSAPNQSLIISSDKKYGIIVYDLKGDKVNEYNVGRINNVDIVPSKSLEHHFIVCGTNRSYNAIDLYLFNESGVLVKQLLRMEVKSLKDVYGITFYNGDVNTYLFISDKKGRVEQWIYNNNEENPKISKVRTLKFSSIVEGIVADEFKAKVYIAQERKGIWEINVSPALPLNRKLIYKKNKFIKPDFEGLTLRDEPNGKGQLIASIQGSNGYLVLDRQTLFPSFFFRIIGGETIDGTTETDGIDVSTISTEKFPEGFFIAQDDDNDGLNQNFKIVDWQKIMK